MALSGAPSFVRPTWILWHRGWVVEYDEKPRGGFKRTRVGDKPAAAPADGVDDGRTHRRQRQPGSLPSARLVPIPGGCADSLRFRGAA